jgi:TonB family protein
VDYADEACHLRRDFGVGQGAVTLDVTKAAGPDRLDIILAGAGVPKLPQRLSLGIQLSPQGRTHFIEAISTAVPKRPARFIQGYDVHSELLTELGTDEQMRFTFGNAKGFNLHISGVRAALAALQTCYENLLHNWSVDPSRLVQDQSPQNADQSVTGNPGIVVAQLANVAEQRIVESWVSWKDYPTAALSAGISGTVVMALDVNAAGRVDNCRVVVSSKFEPLGTMSCEVLASRARYPTQQRPAGIGLPSTAIERIRWVIP